MGMTSKPFGDIFTFSRASSGTSFRPVGYGPDVIVNGGFDTADSWGTPSNIWTISGGSASTTASVININQQLPISLQYKTILVEFDLVVTSGSIRAEFGGANGVTASASGRYSSLIKAIGPDIYLYIYGVTPFTGSIDNISVKEVILDRAGDPIQLFNAPAGVPRIDYDPVTGQCKGILIEGQRTNYFANTENQTYNAGTTQNGLTISKVNEGFVSGCKFVDVKVSGIAGANYLDILLSFLEGGTPVGDIACSVSCAMLEAPMTLPTYRSVKVVDYTSGWTTPLTTETTILDLPIGNQLKRYVVLKGPRADRGVVNFVLSMNAVIGQEYNFTIRLSSPQLEQGSFATSYIPTSGAQATRSADVCSINTLSPWYSSTAGTLVGVLDSITAIPASTYPGLYTFEGASSADRIGAILTPSQAISALRRKSGSADSYAGTVATISPNSQIKFAQAWDSASQVSALNGAAASGTISWDGIPSGINKLRIGVFDMELNGHIRKLKYFPKRLSDSKLQELTA